jgi:hypothetical protein
VQPILTSRCPALCDYWPCCLFFSTNPLVDADCALLATLLLLLRLAPPAGTSGTCSARPSWILPHLPFATTTECSFRHTNNPSRVATSPASCPAHWPLAALDHDARRNHPRARLLLRRLECTLCMCIPSRPCQMVALATASWTHLGPLTRLPSMQQVRLPFSSVVVARPSSALVAQPQPISQKQARHRHSDRLCAPVTSAAAGRYMMEMLTHFPGVLVGPPQSVAQQPSRGLKRSRSPENSYGDLQHGEDGTYTESRLPAAL